MAQAFKWTGEAMVPLRPKLADETFVVGAVVWMEIEQPRSEASHRHEFAWLREAWTQLPENLMDEYPTPEHMRKRALIEAGYFDQITLDAGTQAAALRVAAYMRGEDEFSLVVTRGPLVVKRKAKSQSVRAMGKADFQASKTAIMDVIAKLIGVTPEALQGNAGRAA